eukprot:TRINITY_DN40637_c0_g1_i1.p1 TRINITY_DN40637_c0_g1~~TRINITY_DN40637_c0_g1_i1.p1  ORF type:complete len:630 (+),score=222.02 TRINITY_DN40637_c0_g1_i1:79-1890(+)
MPKRERLLVCAVAGWVVAAALFVFLAFEFGFDAPDARPPPPQQRQQLELQRQQEEQHRREDARTAAPQLLQQPVPLSGGAAAAEEGQGAEPRVSLPPGASPGLLDAELDALPPAAPLPRAPSEEQCAAHRSSFLAEHRKLLAQVNLTADPKFMLKGHWADGDAFCGSHLLYHATGGRVLWMAVGEGLARARTLRATTVSLFNCAEDPADVCPDVDMHARLVGPTITGADVQWRSKQAADGGCVLDITYAAYEPGTYSLELKHVHLNGSSANWRAPLSLGADRTRVRGPNGEKWFARHNHCARQRTVWGSPFQVVIEGPPLVPPSQPTPRCTAGNQTRGRWVPFHGASCSARQPYCAGKPWWLADAYGYNRELLWAPTTCHFHIYSPPTGPMHTCLDRRGVLAIVGDSIAREYVQNCKVFQMMGAGLACEHWHMIINGEYYSQSYVHDVVKVIVDKVHTDKPVVLATNFGMMHMIGMRNDSDWDYFMAHFVQEWLRRPPPFGVRKVWLGPPTIHYATRGMTQQRVARWEQISLRYLEPLGFERLRAHAVTRMREEGSWDGLHNSAEKGHKQSKVRNRKVREYRWNGGVSHMLWNVLLNMLCPQG